MNNNKLNILICTAFPVHGAGSGALVTTQATSYVKSGHNVTIITANNRTDYPKVNGVKYHTVPFTGFRTSWRNLYISCCETMYAVDSCGHGLDVFCTDGTAGCAAGYFRQCV